MKDKAFEEARHRGWVQGAAWAIAVMFRYELRADELLKESGLNMADLRKCSVSRYDIEPIETYLKYGTDVLPEKREK